MIAIHTAKMAGTQVIIFRSIFFRAGECSVTAACDEAAMMQTTAFRSSLLKHLRVLSEGRPLIHAPAIHTPEDTTTSCGEAVSPDLSVNLCTP